MENRTSARAARPVIARAAHVDGVSRVESGGHARGSPIALIAAGERRGGEGRGESRGPIVYVFVFYKKDQLTALGVIVGRRQRTRDDLWHFVGWPAGRGESLLLPRFYSMKRHC